MNSERRVAKGQTALIIAASLVGVLAVLALATDVGVLYYNWTQLRKNADTAALAGAHYLPINPNGAKAAAVKFASLNGSSATEVSINSVAADNKSITIGLSRAVPTYFARAVGIRTLPISVQATAAIKGIAAANGFLPIGLPSDQTYKEGVPYQLKLSQVGPGNWEPLALGGTGASTFEQNLEWGYNASMPVSVGDMLTTEPGEMVGPARKGADARLSRSTWMGSTPPTGDNFDPTDSRVVLVPLVDFGGVQGRSQGPVIGFVTMWIESVDNKGTLTMYLLSGVSGNSQGGSGAPATTGYAVSLVQ